MSEIVLERTATIVPTKYTDKSILSEETEKFVISMEARNGYEIFRWWKKIIWPLTIKIFSGRLGEWLFIRHCSLGRKLRRYATTHVALEMIYQYSWQMTKGQPLSERILSHILFHFINGKAVRNRLRLVEKELKKAVVGLDVPNPRLISYAAGSARAVIYALKEALENGHPQAKAMLIDRSRNALNYSKRLAEKYGVQNTLVWVRGMLEELVQNAKEFPPDIVEMVGIMDYFDRGLAVKVCRAIYQRLPPGGCLITCNVIPNPEKSFLTDVLQWPMIYRQPRELLSILQESGFGDIHIFIEPMGIHALAICTKT